MNKLIFSILLLGAVISRGSHAAKPARINIAFDMNGVTMAGFKETPHFGEMLNILAMDPRIHIYFFSSQRSDDITYQLKTIRVPGNRWADLMGIVVDGTNLTDFDRKGSAFKNLADHGHYKDLRSIATRPIDLANTILVDDSAFKAHPRQLRNLFWLRSDLGWEAAAKRADPLFSGAPLVQSQEFNQTSGSDPLRSVDDTSHAENLPNSGPAPAPPAPPVNTKPQGIGKKLGALWNRMVAVADEALPAYPPPVAARSASTSRLPNSDLMNRRTDLMLGVLKTAIHIADRWEVSVSEALEGVQWSAPVIGPKLNLKMFKLVDPRFQKHMIRYGSKLRANARCAARFEE